MMIVVMEMTMIVDVDDDGDDKDYEDWSCRWESQPGSMAAQCKGRVKGRKHSSELCHNFHESCNCARR